MLKSSLLHAEFDNSSPLVNIKTHHRPHPKLAIPIPMYHNVVARFGIGGVGVFNISLNPRLSLSTLTPNVKPCLRWCFLTLNHEPYTLDPKT